MPSTTFLFFYNLIHSLEVIGHSCCIYLNKQPALSWLNFHYKFLPGCVNILHNFSVSMLDNFSQKDSCLLWNFSRWWMWFSASHLWKSAIGSLCMSWLVKSLCKSWWMCILRSHSLSLCLPEKPMSHENHLVVNAGSSSEEISLAYIQQSTWVPEMSFR